MIQKATFPVGIEDVATYVPVRRDSVEQWLAGEPSGPEVEQCTPFWQDTAIEPERLMEFFARQLANGGGPGERGRRELSVEQLRSSGLEFVHSATGESSSDMALRAGQLLLQSRPELSKTAQLLIYSHSTLNENPTWSNSCRLQHELGLRNAVSFSISQKGSNTTLTSLSIACSLMAAEDDLNTVVLVASDKVVPPYPRALPGPSLLSDGAGALLLQRSGEGVQFLGSNVRDFSEVWTAQGPPELSHQSFNDFIADQARQLVEELLGELGFGLGDLSYLIPPNLNLPLAHHIAQKCSVPRENLFVRNISQFGTLLTAELMVNLVHAARERCFLPDDLIVMVSLGYGLSLGCVALLWGSGLQHGRTSSSGVASPIVSSSTLLPA